MSPDGSLCASGGKDAKAMLWDLNDGKHLYTLDHADTINALASPPTATGCALPPAHLSRFGILKARTWLKNSNPKYPETLLRLDLPNVCLWLGLLMVKLCLLVTLITKSVSGRCLSPPLVKKKKDLFGTFASFLMVFQR